MELDELKYYLNQKIESDEQKSHSELSLLLKKDTFSVVRKLQRSLQFELLCNIIVLLLFIWEALFNKLWSLRIYFGTFIILSIIAMFTLIYLIRKVNKLNSIVLPIKQNIEEIYNIVHSYKVICFRATMLLIPICLIYSLTLGYVEARNGATMDYAFIIQKLGAKIWLVLAGLIIYLIILGAAVYYFTKWWLNRLFGKYLKQLRSLLDEFNDE